MKIGRWTFSRRSCLYSWSSACSRSTIRSRVASARISRSKRAWRPYEPLIHGGLELADRGDEPCGQLYRSAPRAGDSTTVAGLLRGLGFDCC